MGNGNLSIETMDTNGKKVYLLVFRNQIGKTLYSGLLSALKSKKRRIEEKTYKLQLKIALVSKDPKTGKVIDNHCLINFSRSDDLNQFEKDFDEAVEELKKQTSQASKAT